MRKLSLPVPTQTCRFDDECARQWLRGYLTRRREDALRNGTVAGAKYPQLAALGDLLFELLGDNLRVIVCDRPFDESTRSLQKRFPNEFRDTIGSPRSFVRKPTKRGVAPPSNIFGPN